MKKFGLLPGILISIVAIYIVVSVYGNFQKDIVRARLRLTSGSKIITTSQGPIEYATAGEGDPIIVVHGAGGGYDQGLLISEAWLGNYFHRIAVSRFGYLRSPLPAEFSHSSQADIFAELLDSLNIKKAVIMGVSAGGPSTIQFALRHPERCRAVILVSAISHEHPPLSWHHNLVFDLVFNSDLLYWSLVSYLPSSFYTAFGIPPEVQAALNPAQRDSLSYFLHSIMPVSLRKNGTAHDRIDCDLDFPVERIQAPVLVVHAEDDNIVSYANAEYIKEKIPDAKTLAFKTGGHLLIGQYHHIKQTITDFLIQNRDAGEDQ
jgi:pimeloyl-ACP methyl ester carboxylesterase